MRRTTLQLLAVLAAAAAILSACGDDDDTAADIADQSAPAGDDDTDVGIDEGDDDAAPAPSGGGSGTVTVDGLTFTFTADESCVFSPDDPEEFSIVGVGSDPDGDPVHVAAIGPNQLVILLGTDSGLAEAPSYEYNPGYTDGDFDRLPGLEVDGSTVRATPEMVRFDAAGDEFELVGAAEFEATC
jgi:hypothetical protein